MMITMKRLCTGERVHGGLAGGEAGGGWPRTIDS